MAQTRGCPVRSVRRPLLSLSMNRKDHNHDGTASSRRVTGGVDTHGDVHVAAALDSATGRPLGTASFPTMTPGYAGLLGWLREFGELDRVGVESTGSYGAGLTRFLRADGVEVIEVDRPDRKARRFEGKSDPPDAQAAARAVLSGRARSTPKSRDGLVEAIRSLEVVHHGAIKDRTRAINQFKSLLVSAPERLRATLRPLAFAAQLARARRFCDGRGGVVEQEARAIAQGAGPAHRLPRRADRPARSPNRRAGAPRPRRR